MHPCTAGRHSKILPHSVPPDANGKVATLAHYASDDQARTTVHRMQRESSFQTVCLASQDSIASKNAKHLSVLHICKGDTSLMQVPWLYACGTIMDSSVQWAAG